MTTGKKAIWTALIMVAAVPSISGLIAPAAMAQFSDSYNFLKAVKDRDGAEVEKYLADAGSAAVIINTRDSKTGQAALHMVVERHDPAWTGFLLQKGANPNVQDKLGVTPLMLATKLDFAEGIDWLLQHKASIDQTNRSGETALIWAVQLRKPEMVRMLLKAGANPDKADTVAGFSARDYAKQDGRGSSILAIIEKHDKGEDAVKPSGTKGLDFSGIGDDPKDNKPE